MPNYAIKFKIRKQIFSIHRYVNNWSHKMFIKFTLTAEKWVFAVQAYNCDAFKSIPPKKKRFFVLAQKQQHFIQTQWKEEKAIKFYDI